MAFDLSFDSSFFIGPFDLEGVPLHQLMAGGLPTTVYQAILAMPDESFTEMAKDVFQCDPQFVTAEMVLEKVQETNTCGRLHVPVDVWIDAEGDYTLDVYDGSI